MLILQSCSHPHQAWEEKQREYAERNSVENKRQRDKEAFHKRLANIRGAAKGPSTVYVIEEKYTDAADILQHGEDYRY